MDLTRLALIYQLSYNNVKFIDKNEQKRRGIIELFEEHQFVFEDKNYGIIVVPVYNILYIHLANRKMPKNGVPVRRITLEYEITHQNPQIIRPKDYAINNIPTLFEGKKQFAYWVKNFGVYISLDQHVIQVQY